MDRWVVALIERATALLGRRWMLEISLVVGVAAGVVFLLLGRPGWSLLATAGAAVDAWELSTRDARHGG